MSDHPIPLDARPAANPAYRPTHLMRGFLRAGTLIRVGSLTVMLPDGSRHDFTGPEPGPTAELQIHDDRVARRFLGGGRLGFTEAYLDGDWSSPDVEALFVLTLRNQEHMEKILNGSFVFRTANRLLHLLRPNSKPGAKRNIAAHYDLGNAFFEKWLDPSMTYSAGLYAGAETDLGAAQRRKYATLADRIGLDRDQHVLEIGCGWGGFAEYAAGERGAKVTAITISREQHDYARRRIFEAGLAERVDIHLTDYRDMGGQYDKVASIEMFEAVGERYWPVFFGTVRDRLRPGGVAGLQIITIADHMYETYRRSADYIQKYIFPGGMLPSATELGRQVDQAGMRVQDRAGFGPDYARTLRDWNRRFQSAWPEIQAMGFDARFKRMWEQYLHYCAAGFQEGAIDVVHVTLSRD